ncbi:hypothetical protein HW555_007437 [Spodoptera exigua]|uniref:Uncharacterized protein n=1 Tax=Spodoptera exigua TaxID=7107 RepID=A0A835GG20_SPOEX|nr:hypothetical protein HW555_007437 [Spodoptera exigua]
MRLLDNMRINILSSIILILLANDSCADEQKKQNSLITTYDPGASSTVGSNLQNYGQISRNDKPPDRPIKFEDGPEGQELIDNDKLDPSLFLADISFGNEEYLKRVAFIDDSYEKKNQEPFRKKTRKSRKPRYQTKQPSQDPTYPHSPYRGSSYPNYQGAASGYPVPAYSALGFSYPGYPTPYPGTPLPTPLYPGGAFPTSLYPGYPTASYPSYQYPPINPGYGGNPQQGYQSQYSEGQRPQSNPIVYPTPATGDLNGLPVSRYPPPYSNPGSPIGPTQNGHLGFPNPTPDNPYYQGYPFSSYAQGYPGDLNSHNPGHRPGYGYLGANQPGYQNGNGRPSRRPKSLTQRAVSAVAEALTSIALYDDYQCVPKILCDVAGGSTAVSSPALLKATETLQPLLTLLAAYNGLSSSPLFLFGRAAVDGNDCEGFFGQPEQSQQPQNLEQFYNYLSGQYGFQQHHQQQQNYGLLRPHGQGYGYPNQNPSINPQNYAHNYYQGQNRYRNGEMETAESEIQERIQNKPAINILEDENDQSANAYQDNGSTWSFPEDGYTRKGSKREHIRINKETEKPVYFQEHNHFQIYSHYQTTTPVNLEEFVFDHKHNFYVKRPKAVNVEDVNVVYVVRGNGDPNHPEVVRIRPVN